jgi:cobalt/nickel transport system permease protein
LQIEKTRDAARVFSIAWADRYPPFAYAALIVSPTVGAGKANHSKRRNGSMSHIHIPDGILPLWLVAAGWVVTLALLFLASRRLSGPEMGRKIPLLGVMAAVMLVGMSTEFVPIAYHVNLTVLAGIIVGPAMGFLVAFIVNLILALFGHGGITVVGLNTLIIGAECAMGYYIFRALYRLLQPRIKSVAAPAGVAVIVTLFISTMMLIGIVALSNVDPGKARDTGSLDVQTLSFKNPFEEGVISNRVINPEKEAAGNFYLHDSGINLGRFAAAVLLLGSIGWILEAMITAVIVQFIYRVRRELVISSDLRPPSSDF